MRSKGSVSSEMAKQTTGRLLAPYRRLGGGPLEQTLETSLTGSPDALLPYIRPDGRSRGAKRPSAGNGAPDNHGGCCHRSVEESG